jgi:hypothetical protein
MSSNIPLARVLDEFVELVQFAEEVKRHPRTVKRWTKGPDGLSTAWMGRTEYVHVPTARQWLRNRLRQRNSRRTATNESAAWKSRDP